MLQSGFELDQSLAVFADLLSLDLPEGYVSESLSPTGRKKRILKAVWEALLSRANQQPVLLIMEDLHWADASTLDWVDLLMTRLSTHPILVVGTTRPGFQPSWAGHNNVTTLNLQRLSPERIAAICRHQAKGKKLPEAIVQQIKEKTDGWTTELLINLPSLKWKHLPNAGLP